MRKGLRKGSHRGYLDYFFGSRLLFVFDWGFVLGSDGLLTLLELRYYLFRQLNRTASDPAGGLIG